LGTTISTNIKKSNIFQLKLSTGDIIHLHDIYPDLANNLQHQTNGIVSSSHSSTLLTPPTKNHLAHSQVSRPSINHFSTISNNQQYPITQSVYSTAQPHVQLHSYKPSLHRPSTSALNSWEHDTNHLGTGSSGHLDNLFEVNQQSVGNNINHPHEMLPHAQPFAVGNILDLNGGEGLEDYSSGTFASSNFRPVPGIHKMRS